MKQARLILALVLGLALYAAATVGPASGAPAAGATTAQSLGCNPTAPARVFLGRGSTLREPDLGQTADNLPASALGQAEASFTATVPVYFHVVTDGSIGNVTRAQIEAQMDVLDNTYAGGKEARTRASPSTSRGSRGRTTRSGSTRRSVEPKRT